LKGLDLSFAQPSQAWWNKRYTEGWRVLVQDAWTGVVQPTPTLVNLNRARTAGFITAAYVVVNNLPGATSVGWARQACGAEWDYLNFVAVDVEVPTTIKSIEEALFEVTRLGKKRCIYTSKNAWKVVNSTTRFSQEWLWNAYYDGDPDFDFGTGESLRGFYARAVECLSALVARHAGESILVFTHGGVLEMAYRYATARPLSSPRDFEIPNAALNWIEAGPQGWSVQAWADCTHLEAALDDLPG